MNFLDASKCPIYFIATILSHGLVVVGKLDSGEIDSFALLAFQYFFSTLFACWPFPITINVVTSGWVKLFSFF